MEDSLISTLKALFKRDLNKLRKEITAYQQEEKLWVVEKQINNSAGNLCLHLIGNLNTFICAEVGGTSYVRQRDLEFSLKNVPKIELLSAIDQTIMDVDNSLHSLTYDALKADYPNPIFGEAMSTEYFLVHLLGHLNYHLGQINYHRRLLDVEV